jgi:hypothetical protein
MSRMPDRQHCRDSRTDGMHRAFKVGVPSLTIFIIGACGGGGGSSSSSTTATSTLTFPAAQAISNFFSNRQSVDYILTGQGGAGPIAGSGTITFYNPVAVTFEGKPALDQLETIKGPLSGGGVYDFETHNYYTTNYDPVGDSVINAGSSYQAYCVVQGNDTYPSSVKVGDSGNLGTSDCYQDSTKTVATGMSVDSYAVSADTAKTVIISLITNLYSLANQPTNSFQVRFRVDDTGNINFVSWTITDKKAASQPNYVTVTAQ